MLYKQSPLQIKPKEIYVKNKIRKNNSNYKIDQCNPNKTVLAIILRTNLFNMAPDNNGNVVVLQQVLSTAKVLLQTTSQYI